MTNTADKIVRHQSYPVRLQLSTYELGMLIDVLGQACADLDDQDAKIVESVRTTLRNVFKSAMAKEQAR